MWTNCEHERSIILCTASGSYFTDRNPTIHQLNTSLVTTSSHSIGSLDTNPGGVPNGLAITVPSSPTRRPSHHTRITITMVVYTSAWPSVPIVEGSIFSYVFNSKLCTAEQVVYIDRPTGRRLTKANVKHTALSLAHGLRNELHTPNFRGATP